MKSKASYFSVSIPLVKENMRRFWAIPALSFLVYFLSGVFPILMSYDKLNNMAGYIKMSLHNLQPFYMGAHLLIPVVTAVVLFRYLQSVSSVAVMHSLPFTRPKLFNSSLLSGIILTTVPILLNGIILLLLSKPAYQQWGYGADMSIDTVNVFTRGEILNWIWTSLLIVLVVYSISVFAGIVTGNNLMHLLASFFFTFLITVLYAVFNVYFQEYLYGFSLSGDWLDICLSISPYTGVLNNGGYFSTAATLYYIGTFLLMTAISAFLYNKRKLERATDSLTFEFMKPIICYIIAFLGMTLLGFYFEVLGEDRLYMYTGFAAGAIIFFIIGQMIVTKSPRIFNKEGLKSFLVYVLIAALFLIGLNVDATGYERRLPKPDKVESAAINNNFNSSMVYYWQYDEEKLQLKDPENIQALIDFHQSILENRDRFENPIGNPYSSTIHLDYTTNGLFNMNRSYQVDYSFYAASPEMAQVFESLEYKAIYSLYNLGVDSFTSITIYGDTYQENTPEIKNAAEIEELISCIEKDFRNMTFADFISLKHKFASAEICYTYTGDDRIAGRDRNGSITCSIPLTAANSIKWLEDHGYSFGLTADMVESINIYDIPKQDTGAEWAKERMTMDSEKFPGVSENPLKQITDKESICKILDTYEVQRIDDNGAYSIEIKYMPTVSESGYVGPQYIYGFLNDGIDFLN